MDTAVIWGNQGTPLITIMIRGKLKRSIVGIGEKLAD